MRDPDYIAIAKLTIDLTEVFYEAGKGPQAAVPGNPAATPAVAAIATVMAGPNYITIIKSDLDAYRARMVKYTITFSKASLKIPTHLII